MLLGFFPTDVLTSIAVGEHLAANDLPLADSLGFVALTLLLLALSGLSVVASTDPRAVSMGTVLIISSRRVPPP